MARAEAQGTGGLWLGLKPKLRWKAGTRAEAQATVEGRGLGLKPRVRWSVLQTVEPISSLSDIPVGCVSECLSVAGLVFPKGTDCELSHSISVVDQCGVLVGVWCLWCCG